MGAAHRIALDALGLDALAPATLDRVIDAEHNRACRHEPVYQQPK
jgi:hypothetical protein